MKDKGRGQGVVEELAWSPARGPVCYKGYFRQSWPKSTTTLRNLKTPTSKINEFPVPSFVPRMQNRSRYFNSHFCWLNAIICKTNIEQWSCKSPNRGKALWPAIISHVKFLGKVESLGHAPHRDLFTTRVKLNTHVIASLGTMFGCYH